MTNQARALIQRLADTMARCEVNHRLLDEAYAYLAQPESKDPTDERLLFTFYEACLSEGGDTDEVTLRGLHAVFARYGNRTPTPIPLSERYPNLRPDGDDFSKDGCLWWYEPRLKWRWALRDAIDCIPYPTHWLPHWALPVPGQEVSQ